MSTMWSHQKNSAPAAVTDQDAPELNREEKSARAAEFKLKRDRDASQALKEHAAARQETLAKTAKLRAERLAREAAALRSKEDLTARKPAGKTVPVRPK